MSDGMKRVDSPIDGVIPQTLPAPGTVQKEVTMEVTEDSNAPVGAPGFQFPTEDFRDPAARTSYLQTTICRSLLTYVLPTVLIVFGAQNLSDKKCDTLDDGIGIAQWMFISGIVNVVFVTLGIWAAYKRANYIGEVQNEIGTEPSTYTEEDVLRVNEYVTRKTKCIATCSCCVTCFALAVFIYGCVVVFEDHPDDSGCSKNVHAFGFWLIIIQLALTGLFLCCFCFCLPFCLAGVSLSN